MSWTLQIYLLDSSSAGFGKLLQSSSWQSSNMILLNTYYVPGTVLVNDGKAVKAVIDPHGTQLSKE